MEIDKTQSKRKTELDSEPRKGKKSREDIADGSKEKGKLICFWVWSRILLLYWSKFTKHFQAGFIDLVFELVSKFPLKFVSDQWPLCLVYCLFDGLTRYKADCWREEQDKECNTSEINRDSNTN